MDRRRFLQTATASGLGLALGPSAWRHLLSATPGDGPYGPLGPPSGGTTGLRLPEGFTHRVIAESMQPVEGAPLLGPWHVSPDGAATFPLDDGGWVYVCNSEAPLIGGVNALRFDAEGNVVGGYPILRSTSQNCAGGTTPWGTWLSCEEYDFTAEGGPAGMVWECDPSGPGQGLPRPALGRFNHEAVAVDPTRHHLYLTEDDGDGLLYRFTPDAWRDDGMGVLDSGVLEAAAVDQGDVTWHEVPDPSGVTGPTREQVPAATVFDGGEGCWYDSDTVYVATKGDRRVWALDVEDVDHPTIEVIYDATPVGPDLETAVKVDNVTVSPWGDVFVAEDSSDRKRMLLLSENNGTYDASTFLEVIEAAPGSELTGPVFDPSGTRMFFSSQRGASIRDGEKVVAEEAGLPSPFDSVLTHRGITYEVTGPFGLLD
ncbi:MAG TPA: alkaline phosphatase PhoX [Acidimicrobiales bacterium]